MNGLEAVRAVLDALDAASASYMLTGSFASNAYGIARATNDADFIVDFDATHVDLIAKHLDPRVQLQDQMMFETITGTTRYILEVADSPFKIELFHINPDPFMKGRFKRKIEVEYPELGRTVWLPSPEDVVVQKLRWGREKDLSDVQDVLFVSSSMIDFTYVENWCREHGTLEKLNAIRAQLPPDP
jgi:hypothetical protein